MLLDLSRNDIGRVAAFGTVRVLEPLHVEHYSHVMHLVSTVEGILAEGRPPGRPGQRAAHGDGLRGPEDPGHGDH